MSHAPGWIDLYSLLEEGQSPPPALVEQCLGNRNVMGETMLRWYALEGSPRVLQQLIDLGFDIDPVDDLGATPILSAAMIGRWDNVRVLRSAGARTRGVTPCGFTYRNLVARAGDDAPADLRGDAYAVDDLLAAEGPEDQPIREITLRHPRLTREAFVQFCAERPELVVEHERMMIEWHAERSRQPGTLMAGMPSLPTRRLLHHIAVATGARVEWEFCEPDFSE
jgi:hypothetical protein